MEANQKDLERFFDQVDAIKKRSVVGKLEEYIAKGGNGLDAVKRLALSHEGVDHLVHIFSDIFLSVLKMEELKKRVFLDQTLRQFLFSLIEDSFSSTKMDSIFLEHITPPKWIGDIIEDKNWRDLIYRLSEAHKDCLFLKFVVQKISKRGKYHREISSLTSIATSFELFKTVMINQIQTLIKMDEDQFLRSEILQHFVRICGFSQYTYMFAQGTLTILAKKNEYNRGKYIRLSEELERNAIKVGGNESSCEMIGRKISYLFKENIFLTNVENSIFMVNELGFRVNVFSEVSAALLSMLTKRSTNPADINKLHKLYSGNSPPSVEFLQHRDVFDLLIGDLFNPSRSIQEMDKTKYSFLLTLGSIGKLSSSQGKKQEVFLLHRALDESVALCSSKTASLGIKNSVAKLRKNIHFNIIAIGILEWIRCCYTIKTFHLSSYTVENASVVMNFVKEIAYVQPSLRNAVLRLITSLFNFRNIDEDITVLVVIEVKRLYLDVLIYLLRLGHVIESLRAFQSFLNEMDLSLIRFFVSQLVSFVASPFSNEFTVVMREILDHERVRKSKLKRNPKCSNFIDQITGPGTLY